MDRLPYLPDYAAIFFCIAAVHWSRSRFDMATPRAKALAIAAAAVIGCLGYVLVGLVLALALPAHQAALVAELRRNLAIKIISVAAIAVGTFFYRKSFYRKRLGNSALMRPEREQPACRKG